MEKLDLQLQLKKLQKDNENFIKEQQHLLAKRDKEIKQLTADSMKETENFTKQQQHDLTLLEEKNKEIEQLKTDNKKDRDEDKLSRAKIEKELMEAKNLIKQMKGIQRESEKILQQKVNELENLRKNDEKRKNMQEEEVKFLQKHLTQLQNEKQTKAIEFEKLKMDWIKEKKEEKNHRASVGKELKEAKSQNTQLKIKLYNMEKFVHKKSDEVGDLKKKLEKEEKVVKEQEEKLLEMHNLEDLVRELKSKLDKKQKNHSLKRKNFTASCGHLDDVQFSDQNLNRSFSELQKIVPMRRSFFENLNLTR